MSQQPTVLVKPLDFKLENNFYYAYVFNRLFSYCVVKRTGSDKWSVAGRLVYGVNSFDSVEEAIEYANEIHRELVLSLLVT